jgi:hypothetical protein
MERAASPANVSMSELHAYCYSKGRDPSQPSPYHTYLKSYSSHKYALHLLLITNLRLLSPALLPLVPTYHDIRKRHERHQQKQHTQQTHRRLQPARPHILKHHETHERVLAAEEIQHRSVCHCFLGQLCLRDNLAGRFASESHAAAPIGVKSCVVERLFEIVIFGSVVGEGPWVFRLGFGVCLRCARFHLEDWFVVSHLGACRLIDSGRGSLCGSICAISRKKEMAGDWELLRCEAAVTIGGWLVSWSRSLLLESC